MDGLDKKLMSFHSIAMEKLQNILILTGKCDLIIESDLIKGLELVCGAAWLRSKGVDKIYKFDPKQLVVAAATRHLVFFIRGSRLDTMKRVLEQIQALRNRRAVDNSSIYFHIILLPNVEWKHEKLLEDEGMYGKIQLHRFSWDFVTLDTNLLSLELPEVFHQVFLAKDFTVLPSIAKSLRIFNLITRTPNIVITLGNKSEKLWKMVEHLELKRPSRNDDHPNSSDFSALLLIDRDKDLVSNFLTPVTYTGLLAEMYEVSAGNLLSDQSNRIEKGKLPWLAGREPELSQQVQTKSPHNSGLKMNSAVDKTFADNRYRHFSQVITVLSVQAKALGLEGQYSKDMKIHEMKQFVEKLPKVAAAKKELVKHLNFCESIVDELGKHYEMIQRAEENMTFNQNRSQTLQEIEEVFLTLDMNRFVSLKLLVLFHLTFDMTEDELVTSFRSYFNAFGFENMAVVVQLIEVGLLPNSVLLGSSNVLLQQHKIKSRILNTLPKMQSSFQTHATKLKLCPAADAKADQPTNGQPNCPSYVFNGNYIPLVAQLLNYLCTSQNFDEFYSKVSSLDMKISTKLSPDTRESMTTFALNELIKNQKFPELLPFKPKTIMVFVLGGITYAEIAACDLVGQLTGSKIVMSSNRIASGYDLLADLL